MSSESGLFGDCKNADLRHLNLVQASGVLIAVHAESDLIEYCSENSAELLGIQPEQLLGQSAQHWLSAKWLELKELANREGYLEWREFSGVVPLIVAGHRQGMHRIYEFERHEHSVGHWWSHSVRSNFVEQLTRVQTTERCRELFVDWVYQHSGYDRVMMYHFLPGWDGEVIEERCRPGVGGFLGLRFPASDIPPNARRMFTLNWQRTISDVDTPPRAVLRCNEEVQPLDLTYSLLRAAHPVHIQYLKNMGVQASLTLSVVANGKLWGLIACHHLSSLALPFEDRLALEEMARLVSLHLANLLGQVEQRLYSDMRHKLARLQGAMSTGPDDPKLALLQNLGVVRRTFRAGGAWLRFEGEDFFSGVVPDPLALVPLQEFLDKLSREQVARYDTLPEALLPYRALAAIASGLLFIPLSETIFIVLVRPEVIQTVNWAGKPQSLDDNVPRPEREFTPRHSFSLWAQRVQYTAEPWTETELAFSEKLRTDFQQFLHIAHLRRIALHDPLTGLANRLLFEQRLHQEVLNVVNGQSVLALLMIDLDGFKQVNDTLGHGVGDEVLIETATRLQSVVRIGDTVARLGGDEFAILLPGIASKSSAILVAGRIVELVSKPYAISGRKITIGASIGISICPTDTVDESELIECADRALYQVKRAGKSAYSIFDSKMRAVAPSVEEGDRLMQALREDEFRLQYQPIIDAQSGELRGLEAFLRWQQPDGRDRTAEEIMPLAEQRRLAPAIGAWVLESVFKQYQHWLREGLPMVPISVNIGTVEFVTQDLLGQIERLGTLYETGWQWLRLDIKEASIMADVRHAIWQLGKLREAGVGANLDNFGRGALPLSSLAQLPFFGIKMEADFFRRRMDDPRSSALFNIVQSIARALRAQLTVTRIESREIKEALRNEHINFLQGYAIAHPAEPSQAALWLRKPGMAIAQIYREERT